MLSACRDILLRRYMRTAEHPAKYRVVRWLGRNVFPRDGIQARVHPGVELLLHPRDWIEYLLLRGEAYEPQTLDFVQKNLNRGDAAIFAGVNFGLHVVVAAKAVGETGRVIGVEPQPAALLRASRNVRLNDVVGRVELVSAALGAEKGLAHMAWSRTDENAGAANLFEAGAGLTVQLISLSELIKKLHLPAPRMILLDVEGYEIHALQGLGPDAIPDLIVVEDQPAIQQRANASEGELLRTMRSLGYILHTLAGEPIDDGGSPIPEQNVVGVRPGADVVWVRPNQAQGPGRLAAPLASSHA